MAVGKSGNMRGKIETVEAESKGKREEKWKFYIFKIVKRDGKGR